MAYSPVVQMFLFFYLFEDAFFLVSIYLSEGGHPFFP